MSDDFKYSNEQNALMIVALLKAHGIKRVVASPGATDTCLVVSMMYDGSFEMYSCIDERSAAYMACGIAAETGEPVVITCTESTASRDYLPGLTEAYHRKLPILAITGLHGYSNIGHLEPQVIDRSVSPVDSIRLKVNLPFLQDEKDRWDSMIKINQAILEVKRHGGGPVHINLPWPNIKYNFLQKELPDVRVIHRYYMKDALPELPEGKIAVFVGSHIKWSDKLTELADRFCAQHDAVVFCDHSSKFYGKYAVHANLLALQNSNWEVFDNIRLVIHLGEEAADLQTMERMKKAVETWRVSEDGELRDTFRNLSAVFEMTEEAFFENYINDCLQTSEKSAYLQKCMDCSKMVAGQIPELPFSNFYAASKIAPQFPENSIVHLGVSNTIRVWSMFDFPNSVQADSNMGCRGIDGAVSTSIGISLAHPEQICFCILGDLTFFYDMNALGNRHVGNNYRIMIINNGGGNLFKQRGAFGYQIGEKNADLYIAAGGHFGNKSRFVVKNYAEALGYQYFSASDCKEFDRVYEKFVSPEITKPMVFELFIEDEDERTSFEKMSHIVMNQKTALKQQAKKIIGEKGAQTLKGLFGK